MLKIAIYKYEEIFAETLKSVKVLLNKINNNQEKYTIVKNLNININNQKNFQF